jgi:hypothetical protein
MTGKMVDIFGGKKKATSCPWGKNRAEAEIKDDSIV